MNQAPAQIDPYADYGRQRGWSGAGEPNSADVAMFLQVLGDDVAPGKRLLEVGFGDGRLLTWARRRGADVAGLEIQPALVDGARAAGFDAHASIEAFADASFDIVVAFDVLEHVDREVLLPLTRSLAGKLRTGGRLIVRYPNCQVPAGLAIQYSDHTHETPLSEAIVGWLFRAAGLDTITTFGAPETLGMDAGWRMRLRFAMLPLRMRLRRAALRAIGLPRGVKAEHNLLTAGTRPTVRLRH